MAENAERIATAADRLMRVRDGGALIDSLDVAAPTTEAEAWAIQGEVLRRMGGSIGGYKCATPPGKPHSAAILARLGIHRGPVRWPVGDIGNIGIETEIAVRIGRDLPPRGSAYTRDEVLDAVAAVFPAIELVRSRFVDPTKVSVLEAMADNVAHAGFVHGSDVLDWRRLDLAGLRVRQACDGVSQVEKLGGNPSDDPVLPLVWLANYLHEFGLSLRAGEIVTTGSCTGLTFVECGQSVTGAFTDLGEVTVELV